MRLWDSYGKAIRSYAFAARTGRLATNQLDATYLAKCVNEINQGAQDHLIRAQDNAYGSSFPLQSKQYRQASWYFSTVKAFDLSVAYQLNARADFLDAILSNLNYEGGCNPVNICYVTGLGTKRQREIVHQYARNDRRVLPPSGIPLGNIQSGFDAGDTYNRELAGLVFPQEDLTTAPYPYYDRWADAYNLETEFVVLDEARSLASAAFLATLNSSHTQAWSSASAQILVPAEVVPGFPLTASLSAPGLDLSQARVVWEALGQDPVFGATCTFTPTNQGTYWIEAEAQLSDGRRVFASTNFFSTNRPPTVVVGAGNVLSSRIGPTPGLFSISRTGNTNFAVRVNFIFGGTASKGVDYQTPPTSVTLAAGAYSTNISIVPIAGTNLTGPETVILALSSNPSYVVGTPDRATNTIAGNSGPITSIAFHSGTATFAWASVTGSVYQVLYKDHLTDPVWLGLTTNINAIGPSTSWADTPASTNRQRFYRISQVR
jgi:hypothetical protein